MIKLATQFDYVTAWNTGRWYTEAGQRIIVFGVVVDGALAAYFMQDLDRGLDYLFKPLDESIGWDVTEVREYVMHCYDFNLNKTYPSDLGATDFYDARMETQAVVSNSHDLVFTRWAPLYR